MKAWIQQLKVPPLYALLVVLALAGIAGAVASRAGSRRNDAASYFLGRSLDYGAYEQDDEARFTDLELWDKKVHDGLTRTQAMVYVSNRPGRTDAANPADSSTLLLADARHEQRVGRAEIRIGLASAIISVIGISAVLWMRIGKA